MKTVTMHEAQSHLPTLVEAALHGEPFVIAEAGKPGITVSVAKSPETKAARRTGFLEGQFKVPDDNDSAYQEEIIRLFEGE